MSYIVCRNCKRFVEVNSYAPLSFDKCENCGHSLEVANNQMELGCILNNIEIPKVAYEKRCKVCKSKNPRETGACLYCGSTDFNLEIEESSIRKYNEDLKRVNQQNNFQYIPNPGSTFNQQQNQRVSGNLNSENFIYRIVSLIIGFIDFLFFSMLGLSLILGDNPLPQTPELIFSFVQMNITSIALVIVISLLLAGIFSTFVLPSMSYSSSFKLAIFIGFVVGLSTLTVTSSIIITIFSMIICGLITGIGGVIGEFLVHKLLRRSEFK